MPRKGEGPGGSAPAEARDVVSRKLDGPDNITTPVWLQRGCEALHAKGPRPIGELIWELIRGWGPDLEADVRAALADYNRIPAETYVALRADRFPTPRLTLVRGARG